MRPPRPREPLGEESALGPELWLQREQEEEGVFMWSGPAATFPSLHPLQLETISSSHLSERGNSQPHRISSPPQTALEELLLPHFAIIIKLLADQSLVSTARVLQGWGGDMSGPTDHRTRVLPWPLPQPRLYPPGGQHRPGWAKARASLPGQLCDFGEAI